MILFKVLFYVPVIIQSAFFVSSCGTNHLCDLIITYSNDVLDVWMNGDSLNCLIEGGYVFGVSLLADRPEFDCTVHTA